MFVFRYYPTIYRIDHLINTTPVYYKIVGLVNTITNNETLFAVRLFEGVREDTKLYPIIKNEDNPFFYYELSYIYGDTPVKYANKLIVRTTQSTPNGGFSYLASSKGFYSYDYATTYKGQPMQFDWVTLDGKYIYSFVITSSRSSFWLSTGKVSLPHLYEAKSFDSDRVMLSYNPAIETKHKPYYICSTLYGTSDISHASFLKFSENENIPDGYLYEYNIGTAEQWGLHYKEQIYGLFMRIPAYSGDTCIYSDGSKYSHYTTLMYMSDKKKWCFLDANERINAESESTFSDGSPLDKTKEYKFKVLTDLDLIYPKDATVILKYYSKTDRDIYATKTAIKYRKETGGPDVFIFDTPFQP